MLLAALFVEYNNKISDMKTVPSVRPRNWRKQRRIGPKPGERVGTVEELVREDPGGSNTPMNRNISNESKSG